MWSYYKLQLGLSFHFHIYKLQVDLSVHELCRKCQFYKQFYKLLGASGSASHL